MQAICIPVNSKGVMAGDLHLRKKRGKTMLRYVYEAACRARSFDRIILATNSKEVASHASSWGCQIYMSDQDHRSKSRLVAEAVSNIANCASVVAMLNPNEPEMVGGYLDKAAARVGETGNIATVAAQSIDDDTVRVAVSKQSTALYFTRSVLAGAFQSLGVCAFSQDHLERIASMPSSPIADTEKLEQLEWIDNGMAINVVIVDRATRAMHTAEDWRKWKPPSDLASI